MTTLTAPQSLALFDILTHHETYAEVEAFKFLGAIHEYGPPFQNSVKHSSSPILQALLSKFALKLPGLRDVSPEFWKTYVEDLIQELSEAELSESYDKGSLGIRKTLATAVSALLEYLGRGCIGGLEKRELDKAKTYDPDNAEDVLQSWPDSLQEVVYGDLVDRVFVRAAETDDLTQHEHIVQALHEFILVNLASLMHYTLILSPKGASLLRMIESVHRLLPYVVIRQTLKIGNVATMISGMVRIILAKVSVASVTNWIGLSSGAAEGMNLLQQIISTVLGSEKRDLQKRAEKIEKDSDGPPAEIRDILNDWITRSREEHEECRRQSKEQGISIVAIILSLSSSSTELSEAEHANSLEYLSLHLSMRDRTEIIRVLCHRNPDYLTSAVRTAVDAYTPLIRHVHHAVNLSDTLWDFERFVADTLKVSKGDGNGLPTVDDFVDLLHRHHSSLHKFLHQVAKNGKELTSWWLDFVHQAAAQFRQDDMPPPSEAVVSDNLTRGKVRETLDNEFTKLSAEDQAAIVAELDAHHKYLDDLHTASAGRIRAIVQRSDKTPYGPGAYLAKWQDLMDSTAVTPETAHGPVRFGVGTISGRKNVDGLTQRPPASDRTVKCFAQRFKDILSSKG